MMRMLPPELILLIIDHLHADIHALRTCTLVSHAWLNRARFHMFRTVHLTPVNSKAFADTLSANPHVAFFIQSLNIRQKASQRNNKLCYLDNVISAIAPDLTRVETLRVETLRLSNLNLTHLRPMALEAFLTSFLAVKSLLLSAVTFSKFHDFTRVLLTLHYLEHLELGHIWWSDTITRARAEDTTMHTAQSDHLRLRSISLSHTSCIVVAWLVTHYHTISIKSVTNSTMFSYDMHPMARMLGMIGPALEHLTLCLHSVSTFPLTPHEVLNSALISSNTSLRTITLDCIILIDPFSPRYAWVPIILSQISSPYVEEVIFFLAWNRLKPLESFDLEEIDRTLARPLFGGLKRVVFRCSGYIDPSIGVRAITERMRVMGDRGLLVFEWGRESALKIW
ncbi:hypothetical protein K439DRAFT_48905 [Ramaria rubella]|nr:hypothetical protein K439DRAFT_48905 [Ramaria rubella]